MSVANDLLSSRLPDSVCLRTQLLFVCACYLPVWYLSHVRVSRQFSSDMDIVVATRLPMVCPRGLSVIGGACGSDKGFVHTAPTDPNTFTCGGHGQNKLGAAICTARNDFQRVEATGKKRTCARCSAGYVVVGGGCTSAGPEASSEVIGSTPGDDGTSWCCRGAPPGGDYSDVTMHAWAFCTAGEITLYIG